MNILTETRNKNDNTKVKAKKLQIKSVDSVFIDAEKDNFFKKNELKRLDDLKKL